MYLRGNSVPGNKCKDPEAGIDLVCLRNSKETSVIGVGRPVGDEVREVMGDLCYLRSSCGPL